MTVFRLHHRLHWPFCLALATLALLGTYMYVAVPQLMASRSALKETRHQAQLRQDSLALWPLQPLVTHAMQPLPSTADIADILRQNLADYPLTDVHYSLAMPVSTMLGNLPAHSQRLTLSFQTDDFSTIKAIISALPGLMHCHAQLSSLSVDQYPDRIVKLSARLEFLLLGTDK